MHAGQVEGVLIGAGLALEAGDQLLIRVGGVGHLVRVPPLEVALAHDTFCAEHSIASC